VRREQRVLAYKYIDKENKFMEFASRGAANTGIALGGTALGLSVLGGALPNILGGWGGNCGCSENTGVNRYELGQEQTISRLQSEVALRDANIFTDQKLSTVYTSLIGEIKDLTSKVYEMDKAQAVKNAQIEGTFAVLGEKINAQRNEFMCALNREAEQRCCGLSELTTYVNATFYPKMVADVTVGTTTTAQPTYNPISNCGCRC
jgi:hypothetical protein